MTNRDIFLYTSGPSTAKILIVGESWGSSEAAAQRPFVGASGQELDRMLVDAGLSRDECLCTNVVPERPPNNDMWEFFIPRDDATTNALLCGLHPKENVRLGIAALYNLIDTIRPRIIVAVGNYAMWALTDVARISYSSASGKRLIPTGITDFRGSMLRTRREVGDNAIPVLPIIHPAAILQQWELRAPTVHDLRTRVPQALNDNWEPKRQPYLQYNPTYQELLAFFETKLSLLDAGRKVRITNDVETYQNQLTCIGFGLSAQHAIVFPLVAKAPAGSPYVLESRWTVPQEVTLTRLMLRLLTHPNIEIMNQMYSYDMSMLYAHYGVVPQLFWDTLGAQHLLWPGTQKDLGYLSSLYCQYHRYWKDDNRNWSLKVDMNDHLRYNAEDCVRTYEIAETQMVVLTQQGLISHWPFELEKHRLAFEMSIRGVRIDKDRRVRLSFELAEAAEKRMYFLLRMVPQSVVDAFMSKPAKVSWPTSTSQQKIVFYELFGMKLQTQRKTGAITLDKEALPKIKKQAPWTTRIVDTLLELRSIGVFSSTFVNSRLDPDGRMRTNFNSFGTETFRWSSSETPFGTGGNLQNLPKGKEE